MFIALRLVKVKTVPDNVTILVDGKEEIFSFEFFLIEPHHYGLFENETGNLIRSVSSYLDSINDDNNNSDVNLAYIESNELLSNVSMSDNYLYLPYLADDNYVDNFYKVKLVSQVKSANK